MPGCFSKAAFSISETSPSKAKFCLNTRSLDLAMLEQEADHEANDIAKRG